MAIKYCFLFPAVVIFQIFTISQGYDSKYDNIDLDEILKNDRLRHNYVMCLLGEGPCTPDGLELKNSLPDAIQSDCSKCTEKQKIGADKVSHFLIDNKPDEWEKLAAKFDKNDEYKQKYLLDKHNSNENNESTDSNED